MSIKKISALLLAVLLIASTAVFSVSAVSRSYSYIYNYALKVKMDISSTGEKKPYAYYYYDHSYKLAEEILSLSEETESIELQNKYDELKDFYENPWIRPSGAGYTCYYAVNEKNDNNWYSDEVWNTFVEKREKLFNALSVNNPNFELKEYGEGILDKDYTIKQQKYISECFYELLEVFNTMTCQNIVLGDVNGDGVVSVVDATLVQKYIIGEVDFNCAQKLRARVNWNAFPITVKESTTIQKYIVGYTDVYFYTGGIVENESDFATSLDNWEICSQW